MADIPTDPSGPWKMGAQELNQDWSTSGRDDPGWGTVPTKNQLMSGQLRLYGYLLAKTSARPSTPENAAKLAGHDYYAVAGHMGHSVTHDDDYKPSTNWASVGYYATGMRLALELVSQDGSEVQGSVWDAGPTTTVGSNTTSFSIGGGISAGMFGDTPTANVDMNASFGTSFSSPNVTISEATIAHQVLWTVALPGVGFVSPGSPANPLPPSYVGYQWQFGAIFEVPSGSVFSLSVRPRIVWDYDWTRGITNDTKSWDQTYNYTYS